MWTSKKRGAPGNFSSDIWKPTKKTWCISEMQKKGKSENFCWKWVKLCKLNEFALNVVNLKIIISNKYFFQPLYTFLLLHLKRLKLCAKNHLWNLLKFPGAPSEINMYQNILVVPHKLRECLTFYCHVQDQYAFPNYISE